MNHLENERAPWSLLKKDAWLLITSLDTKILSKKGITIVLFLFVLFYFKNTIAALTAEYFTTNSIKSSLFLDGVTVLATIILIWFQVRLIRRKYSPSFRQWVLVYSVPSIYFFLRIYHPTEDWSYISFEHPCLDWMAYLDIIFGSSTVFLIVHSVIATIDYTVSLFSRQSMHRAYLIEDNPLKKFEFDELGYTPIRDRIAQIILKSDFNHSFSIGLVGPWGNGKTSLFHGIEQTIKEKQDDSILIQFKPSLNHSEADIISEFFAILSETFRVFDGSLSNHLIDYSQRLIQLYKKGDLHGFFKPLGASWHFGESATTMYQEVNKILIRLAKKTVVFVDDLDRLNAKEILQVLKLLRNTANFHNMVFLVSLDKEYVINTLREDKLLESAKFLDKFFQAEFYLPEIDHNKLKDLFLSTLEIEGHVSESVITDIKVFIELNTSFFSGYVRNMRDLKRMANQFHIEYGFMQGKLDVTDILGYALLKAKFPRVLKLLNDRAHELFDYSDNVLSLKLADNQTKEVSPSTMLQFGSIPTERIDPHRFILWSVIGYYKEDSSSTFSHLTNADKLLLTQTVQLLFDDSSQHHVSELSIRRQRNFHYAMKMTYGKEFIRDDIFNEYLKQAQSQSAKEVISTLRTQGEDGKFLDQLVIRHPKEVDEYLAKLRLLLCYYSLVGKESAYDEKDIKTALDEMFNFQFSDNTKENVKSIHNTLNEFFSNEDYKLERRGWLLLFILENSNYPWFNDFKHQVKHVANSILKEHLTKYGQAKNWKLEDFGFFAIYHILKRVPTFKDELNKRVLDLLSKIDISVFCAQVLELDFGARETFKLSNVLVEFFGDYRTFFVFLKGHEQSNTQEIKEYIDLLELFLISRLEYPMRYKFRHFKTVDYWKVHPQMPKQLETDSRLLNIFLEFEKKEILDKLSQHHGDFYKEISAANVSVYGYNNRWFLVILWIEDDVKSQFRKVTEVLVSDLETLFPDSKIRSNDFFNDTADKSLISRDNDVLIKVRSVQPFPH